MYFLISGKVGICYSLPGTNEELVKFPKIMYAGSYIGDYYVTSGRKCEFWYIALTEIRAWCLKWGFVQDIFKKFPTQGEQIKVQSFVWHKNIIWKPLVL